MKLMRALHPKTWLTLARRDIAPIALLLGIALPMLAFIAIADEVGEDEARWFDQSLLLALRTADLPVAVVEELPFHLEIVQPTVPIVRAGMMQLKVVAKKNEGWDEEIHVQFPFRPPGIGANSEIVIPKGQTEGLYQLNADGNAALGKWPIYALGWANINGAAWASSQMANLEVAEPYVGLEIQRASVEQGKETEMPIAVSLLKEIKQPAQVTLVGLPHKVTAEPLQINADTKELVFKIKTAPDSPEGTHKNVFCQVTVVENGEQIVHARLGNSELRIDNPLPMPTAAPAPAPMPAAQAAAPMPAPAPPAEKRLTRLRSCDWELKRRAAAKQSRSRSFLSGTFSPISGVLINETFDSLSPRTWICVAGSDAGTGFPCFDFRCTG